MWLEIQVRFKNQIEFINTNLFTELLVKIVYTNISFSDEKGGKNLIKVYQ